MTATTAHYWNLLRGNHKLLDETVDVHVNDLGVAVRSNSPDLLDILRGYFSAYAGDGACDQDVVAIDADTATLDVDWTDWTREPGKRGRKDAICDLSDGRLLRKVRTGMVFLQSTDQRLAIGPCLEHSNQVINFICSQIMTARLHRGALICHAAGIVLDGRCLGIAGFSGGGKSTLMLRLLRHPHIRYLTNDRLFVANVSNGAEASGLPKMPRVNPGTLVHDRVLRQLLSSQRCEELLSMPAGQLWELEEKHDVDVGALYGPDKVSAKAALHGIVVLNWSRDDNAATRLEAVVGSDWEELLPAIMKSPGPFFQNVDGTFRPNGASVEIETYRRALASVPMYQLAGGVDFGAAADLCFEVLSGSR